MEPQRTARAPIIAASVAVVILAVFAVYYVTTEGQVSALSGEVSTLRGQVSSLNDSLNARLRSEAITQCIRTGSGTAFYVRVAADGTNRSVSGAEVYAIPYTECASGYTDFGGLITTVTPSNGTIALPVGGIDGYIVIANYHGSNYTAGEVFAAPVEVTIVTLSVPSGNTTVAHSQPF